MAAEENRPQTPGFTEPTLQSPPPDPSPTNSAPQPVPPSDTHGLNPQPLPPKTKRRKLPWIMAIVIVVALALTIGGWLYYTHPQRVAADSFAKIIESDSGAYKGALEFSTKGESAFALKVDFAAEGEKANAKVATKSKVSVGAVDINLESDFLFANKETYFKLNNLKELTELLGASTPEATATADLYKPLVEKLDGKWVKIDNQEPGAQELSKCSQALNDVQVSQADEKNIKKLFREHQFVNARTTSGGSFTEGHYNLSLDDKKAQEFFDNALKLESFKKLKDDCNIETATNKIEDTSTGEQATVKAELWAHKLSHKPSKFMITAEDKDMKFTFTTNIELGNKVTVNAPSDATPLSQVLQEFQTQTGQQLIMPAQP